jgi:hypothetical protein
MASLKGRHCVSNQCSDRLDRRRFLHLATVPLALLLADAAHAESQDSAGAVEDLKGEAFAEKDAKRRALERAAPLFIQDQVGTGVASRLTMRLGRDTTLKLGERARLVLDRYLVDAGGEISLESGPLLFDRPRPNPKAPVRIRSSFGLIAVRGTRFFAGPSNNVFGVFVARGSVAVSAAGRRVVLRAGEGTDIARPGAPPTPPKRWGEPRIRAALASVS